MYKWRGKEGCRLLFRIYSTPDFIPVTPLRLAFGPYRERLHPATKTAGLPSGNGRVACVDFGKRLDAGSGTAAYRYSERESCGWPPAMFGKKRGAHVKANLLTAGFPLNAQLQRNCARQPTGHNRFQ
ncbi:hypothetical protein D9G39_14785 [Escherichia coli]|nr:hypothetical protein [Escherichia coli]MGQ25064.1 hypothetical protein [Escherichia coli]